jgi:putative flippase GtrA
MKISSKFIIFLMGGVLSFSLDWISFLIMITFFGIEFNISKLISFLLGTLFAFYFNSRFTFRKNLYIINFYKFLSIYFFSMIINILIFSQFSSRDLPNLELRIFMGLLIATTASASMNYFGIKYFVFNGSRD